MAKINMPTARRNPMKGGPGNATAPKGQNPASDGNKVSPENEAKFILYVKQRLEFAAPERLARYNRCAAIDIQLSGFIEHDRDDRMRFRDILLKGRVKPTDHNLPLADAQLDDAAAYMMSVFAPDMMLFESAAPVDKQEAAKALTDEINKQGIHAQYYREFTKTVQGSLRYNFAAITCFWEEEQGYVFTKDSSGGLVKESGTVWKGNAIKTCDIYNFFYDTNVNPVDLPKKGEWFAEVDLISPFRALKEEQDGKCYGVNRFYDVTNCKVTPPQLSYYMPPPEVRKDHDFQTGQARTNWVNAYRGVDGPAASSAPGIERWKWVSWIRPADWGFSNSKNLELWYVEIAQGMYITRKLKLDDTHGMLPIAISTPIEDDLDNNQRTYAERLIPLQHFASFLMNTHQQGVRKALYGITVYDQRLFPGLDLSKEDLTSATIPMRGSAMNVDIDKAFRHYNSAPGTEQNVDMIEKVDAIMQKILPTDLYRQVADLERATLYQAAATVQTGNRRSLKIARMISTQCLETLKRMMIYNIYAKQEAISITKQDGSSDTITPAQFVDLGLENYISNGLKGIDRLMIISAFKEVLSMILQSQQAIAELDIVKLLGYFFNLVGEQLDLNSFRKTAAQKVEGAVLGGQVDVTGGQPAAAPAAAQA